MEKPTSIGFTPLNGHIFLREAPQEKTSEGIIAPRNHKEYQVVNYDTKETLPIKIGDHVLITEFAGKDLFYEGEKYTVIEYEDIVAISHKNHAL